MPPFAFPHCGPFDVQCDECRNRPLPDDAPPPPPPVITPPRPKPTKPGDVVNLDNLDRDSPGPVPTGGKALRYVPTGNESAGSSLPATVTDTKPRGRRKGSGPNKAPRTGLDTRGPKDQNDHTLAMLNSSKIGGNGQLAAMVIGIEIGAERGRRKLPPERFKDVVVKLDGAELARKMGVAKSTAVDAAKAAVKAGFLVRVDPGKGGKIKSVAAKYRACLPDY